jgi:glutaredoxin 3
MIEIYGKTQCPYCDMAKGLCIQEKLDYNYKQLDVDFTREQLFELFPGARTFPQIKIDGESIGGYTELREHVAGRRTLLTEG